MSGICTPITDMICVHGEYGGIAIHFQPGEKWEFQLDKSHHDRLIVHKNNRMSISLTVDKFYEVFDVEEREK